MIVTQGMQGMGAEASSTTPYDQRRLQSAVRSWNGRSFSAHEAIPVLETALQIAQANRSRTNWQQDHFPIGTGLYTEAITHLKQVEFLLDLMKKQRASPYMFAHPHKTWVDVRKATLDPIMWQSNAAAVGAVLEAAEEQLCADLVDGILNLPGNILSTAMTVVANTLEAGLGPLLPKTGIPGWVAPVLVGGVALGVGTWLYSTLRKVTP